MSPQPAGRPPTKCREVARSPFDRQPGLWHARPHSHRPPPPAGPLLLQHGPDTSPERALPQLPKAPSHGPGGAPAWSGLCPSSPGQGDSPSPSEPPFPGPPLGPRPDSVLLAQEGGECPSAPACGCPPPHAHRPGGICCDCDQLGSGLSETLQILPLIKVPPAPGDGRGSAGRKVP